MERQALQAATDVNTSITARCVCQLPGSQIISYQESPPSGFPFAGAHEALSSSHLEFSSPPPLSLKNGCFLIPILYEALVGEEHPEAAVGPV